MNSWAVVQNSPRALRALLQAACGYKGHVYGSEWGYGGGRFVDAWCMHCNAYRKMTVAQAQALLPVFWKTVNETAPELLTGPGDEP